MHPNKTKHNMAFFKSGSFMSKNIIIHRKNLQQTSFKNIYMKEHLLNNVENVAAKDEIFFCHSVFKRHQKASVCG